MLTFWARAKFNRIDIYASIALVTGQALATKERMQMANSLARSPLIAIISR
jgi:hypothetical protein